MEEIWRPIPGHEGYEASSMGRIRSTDRIQTYQGRWGLTKRRLHGKILDGCVGSNGYRTVALPKPDGGYRHLCVNRLVFSAFERAPEPWEEVDHADRDRANNSYANLSALTVAENRARRVCARGAANGMAKLTEAQVRQIKALLGSVKHSQIALDFGVSRSAVGLIANGHNWSHVQ